MALFVRFLSLPLLLFALAGCKLIDQTTFSPELDQEQAATSAASSPIRAVGQVALVTIRYDTPDPAFQDPLSFAIRAAEQRRPGGEYDVMGVSTAADASRTARESAAIMEAMVKLGVTATRIHLRARIDPAQKVREVRVHLH